MIVKMLLLLAPAAVMWAADLCPAGAPSGSGAQPTILAWSSYQSEVRKKICLGNEVRNSSGEPLAISWPEAGIEQTVVLDRIRLSICCFEGAEWRPATLRYGSPLRDSPVKMRVPAEEGQASHEEGYPDLIEGDARIRTLELRGALRAGSETARVDLVLKCSASRFAKQFAYQFSITDRSADSVDVDWDLLRNLRSRMTPSVQPIPGGKTYIFVSAEEPRESVAVIVVKTKTGQVAGRFRFNAFTTEH